MQLDKRLGFPAGHLVIPCSCRRRRGGRVLAPAMLWQGNRHLTPGRIDVLEGVAVAIDMDHAGKVPGAGFPAPLAICSIGPENPLNVGDGRAVALIDLGVHLFLGKKNWVHGVLHVQVPRVYDVPAHRAGQS